MSVRDLIPWGRNTSNQSPSVYRNGDQNPFLSLHREMNRLFDDVFRSFDRSLPAFGGNASFNFGWPNVEISETDKQIKVSADIPGMTEDDIEVLLNDGVLTIRGEKQSENNDDEKQFSERFYGHFERHIPLGAEVVDDTIDARFKNGVLDIVLPKSEKAQSQVKRIAINHG